MKAIIEFDLDNHEDKKSYKRVNASLDMAIVLWEIRHNLRKKLEDSNDVDKVFYEIFDLMDKYGVIVDDLLD